KITGSVDDKHGAMTVLHQVKQCLTIPLLSAEGEHESVNRVYVITPFDISQTTILSISGELQDRSGQVKFVYGSELLDLFNQHYSDYLLLKSGLLTSYVSLLRQAFEDAGPLHNLSIRHGILNSAQRATARAYVKPEFLLPLQAIERTAPTLKMLEQLQKGITLNQLFDIVSSLK